MSSRAWSQLKHLLRDLPDPAIRQLLWARANNIDSLFQRGAVVVWVEQMQDEAGTLQDNQVWELSFVKESQVNRLKLSPNRAADLAGLIDSYVLGQEIVLLVVNQTPIPNEFAVGIATVEIPDVERWY